MSRDLVATLVESKARQDYNKLFLVKYVLLQDTLAKNAGPSTRSANYLRKNLSPIGSLPSQVVLEKATPFFRMNLQRCLSANSDDEPSLMEYSQNLVMMAVDSYFEHLPLDHPFHFQFEEQFHVVLPRLNLRVPVPAGDVNLRRTGARTIQIGSGNGELPIDLMDVPAEFRLLSFHVPGNSATLLLTSDPALFEKEYISSIQPDTKNVLSLIEQIEMALRLIALVDGKLSAAINRYIQWYIPLINPNPVSTHHSFTAKNLPGVMFLSGSYRFLSLCEAIVHEYHHHELYTLAGTKNVLGEETDRLFYSPWRNDARPLSGLFHALHVFTGVADFYSLATKLNLPELKAFETSIQYRRQLLCHQLAIGLAQVPRADLPPLGQKIYDYMEQHLAGQRAELKPAPGTQPSEILTHFDDWSALHPELVPEVKLPAEFFSHSNV